MDSDHPEPVVRHWIAGFFISLFALFVPLSAVTTDRVKVNYEGSPPKSNGRKETGTKRALPAMDVGDYFRVSSDPILFRNLAL